MVPVLHKKIRPDQSQTHQPAGVRGSNFSYVPALQILSKPGVTINTTVQKGTVQITYKNDRPNTGGQELASSYPSLKALLHLFLQMQLQNGNWQICSMFKYNQQNTQSNIQMLFKKFSTLSNPELYQCSTTKSQLSHESIQKGVTIKYQSFKDRK